MKKTSSIIVTICLGLLLSGCQLFQTVEEPIPTHVTLSAQQIVSNSIKQLYEIHSGTWIENYDLALYHNEKDFDHWTATIRENWHDNPDQSLADIHLTLSLPQVNDPNKTAQGIINLSTARSDKTNFGKINDVHFAGPDGHLLDEQIQQWAGQWFTLPPTSALSDTWQWLSSISNFPTILKEAPAEIMQQGKYFTILDESSVQMDDEQAYQYHVALDQNSITQVIDSLQQTTKNNTAWQLVNKLLASSTFDGNLLIGKDSHAPRQLAGTLTIQSPINPGQKIVLRIHWEMNNINNRMPVAIPTQSAPLPAGLLNDVANTEKILE